MSIEPRRMTDEQRANIEGALSFEECPKPECRTLFNALKTCYAHSLALESENAVLRGDLLQRTNEVRDLHHSNEHKNAALAMLKRSQHEHQITA